MRSGAVPLLAFVWAAAAPAELRAADLRPAIVAGYDTGGDKVVTVPFRSGNTDSIKANEGVYVGGGVSVLNGDKTVEFQGTVSVKYAGISASNGEVTWIRYPVDALVFYRAQYFRAGGGITYVIHPQLKGTGEASNIGSVTYDNAAGLVFQIDYVVAKVDVGLRLTALDYKLNGNTIKSSGAGLSFAFAF